MSSEKPKKKSILRTIGEFFHIIQTGERSPDLQRDYEEGSFMDSLTKRTDLASALGAKPGVSEERHRYNLEMIEISKLDQQREITNNNLKAQHRTLIMTTIATFIALLSSGAAIFIALQKDTPPAPVVNVTPAQQAPADINVYVPQQPTNSPSEAQ